LLGESSGQPEEDRGNHIFAIATIVSPTDPARDPTAGPLQDYTSSALIDTGTTHNFILRQVVEKAGLKLIKRLSSAVSLINGAELPIAGVYRETLRITDGNKETRLQSVTLRCVDLHGFNIVLGMP
jgi:predicted aspartyl protease